tara:strand:- start:197 stop:745 length:549 start_codon:yes stop_codon:yes gene_type:complete
LKRLALIAFVFAAGCETVQSPSAPPSPKPKISARPEPKTVPLRHANRAEQMAVMIRAKPRDTDADGYPDTIDVTAVLINGNDPVLVPGVFEFELQPLDESIERPWRVWTFNQQQSAAAAGPAVFDLPGYSFALDLRQNGGDRMPALAANVTARFLAIDGGPVVEAQPGQRVVQVGRGRSAPQ